MFAKNRYINLKFGMQGVQANNTTEPSSVQYGFWMFVIWMTYLTKNRTAKITTDNAIRNVFYQVHGDEKYLRIGNTSSNAYLFTQTVQNEENGQTTSDKNLKAARASG